MTTCTTCKFRGSDGSCRRYPPTSTVLLMPGKFQGSFVPQPFTSAPLIQEDFWCGEWQANVPTLKLAS
jgi:hypothetical protein